MFTSLTSFKTHYTAVVQLADMFNGGVQIDHYNIQLDNGTLLRTAGPTYSVHVADNVTVFMNISAYSCGGYSDSFILEISLKVKWLLNSITIYAYILSQIHH